MDVILIFSRVGLEQLSDDIPECSFSKLYLNVDDTLRSFTRAVLQVLLGTASVIVPKSVI